MSIPRVTCSADVILSYSASPVLVSLGATATESPTSWLWTILSVPDGSTANLGTKGDFTNGVSYIQNPQLLIDGGISGGYTIQCVAINPSGSSDPDADREAGQQLIFMRTQKLSLWLIGDWAYDWGQRYLDKTLRALEAAHEVIVGSNVGTSGVGVYKQKSGSTLQFKKISAGSTKITVTDDTGNDEVDIDLVPGNIGHQYLSGAGVNDHTSIDTHLGDMSNPHLVIKSQVGLGNVTDDAQLTRAAGDFGTFTEKVSSVDADILLLEDSEDSWAKSKIQIGTLVTTPRSHAASHEDGGGDEIDLSGLSGANDAAAIHEDVAAEISALTEKASPIGADLILIEDSEDSDAKKKVQLSSLVTTPASHAASHQNGGGDEIATGTPAADAIPKADGSGKLDGWVTADAVGGTSSLRKLGTGSTDACAGDDSRLSDSRTPTDHASSHQSGGGDEIKLDDFATPDDNTDLDATTGQHGLLPKLGGGTTNFLRADGSWAAPLGSGYSRWAPFRDDVQKDTQVDSPSWDTKKTVRLVLDGALPAKYRAVLSVWADSSTEGDVQVTISDGVNTSTISFSAFSNTSEAVVTAEVTIHASHSLGSLLTVNFDLCRTSGSGSVYMKYTDLILVP